MNEGLQIIWQEIQEFETLLASLRSKRAQGEEGASLADMQTLASILRVIVGELFAQVYHLDNMALALHERGML
jgi:hypothetical protein